jgi:hypothetical protein
LALLLPLALAPFPVAVLMLPSPEALALIPKAELPELAPLALALNPKAEFPELVPPALALVPQATFAAPPAAVAPAPSAGPGGTTAPVALPTQTNWA